MSKIAYLQCPTGIAGDMFLGALVDAGMPLKYLIDRLKSLNLSDEYSLTGRDVQRQGQRATKVEVNLKHHHHHHHRHLPEIEQIITQANLPETVTNNSLAIFRQLAIAEGKVHGISPEKVHFHEVGATDALVDIIGTCIGLDYFNINSLECSPLPTGGGTIKAAHGKLSVPVPAVLELCQMGKVPLYSNGIDKELVTPTGAAIVTTLAKKFGQPPTMNLDKVGLGAGNQDLAMPNILRLWIGEKDEVIDEETVAVLETQIDDLSPQIFGYVMDELLQLGARDVFTQPVAMKKNRPGVLLTVICDLDRVGVCEGFIFRETSTLGIRKQIQTRSILSRHLQTVSTKYGDVRVKIAQNGSEVVNIQPEYDDCVSVAKRLQIPLGEVMLEVRKAIN
ncbi:nickel pincer cofactor biosynthesis protein LarC [Cyanobacterium stanieri LEGE 03274]|uniref:Putative nickel insertion protein n=1 Tax=Cyanobacterium stanieri LEGE 03274 TaxID=1828756 RepID=A0ABR9V2G3_9CHRO|nr:nickel pincer cofactor biosynthesis protein LarC [Cyanobacterium stanieri]MBE9222086.1 nickel pincer cofactor biosynthesis protein LarC [Cyanobacterium stanieri LEGE 03274]